MVNSRAASLPIITIRLTVTLTSLELRIGRMNDIIEKTNARQK